MVRSRLFSIFDDLSISVVADSLAEGLKHLNIKVLNVIPGGLRTGRNTIQLVPPRIPEYTPMHQFVNAHMAKTSGKEMGDPKKVAAVDRRRCERRGCGPRETVEWDIILTKQKWIAQH